MGRDSRRVAYLGSVVRRVLFRSHPFHVLATSYRFLCMHGDTRSSYGYQEDFGMIAIPINAAVYAVVIFGLMRILTGKRTSN